MLSGVLFSKFVEFMMLVATKAFDLLVMKAYFKDWSVFCIGFWKWRLFLLEKVLAGAFRKIVDKYSLVCLLFAKTLLLIGQNLLHGKVESVVFDDLNMKIKL